MASATPLQPQEVAMTGGSFDCEHAGSSGQHSANTSKLSRPKKYAIAMVLGAAVGMLGSCTLEPLISKLSMDHDGNISFDLACIRMHLAARNASSDAMAECGASKMGKGLDKAMAKAFAQPYMWQNRLGENVPVMRGTPMLPATRVVRTARMTATVDKVEAAEEAVGAEENFKGAEAWSAQFAEPEAVFDVLKVKDILPHRYPFLLVDKIIDFVPGKKAVGIKKVTANEEFFNGHFPQRPIMPGVLQIEAMAQVGGIIALQEPITDGKGDFFFAGINNVKWRRPVVPGDTLTMEMELTAFKPRFGLVKMKGTAYVDGQKVVEGDFQFAMVK